MTKEKRKDTDKIIAESFKSLLRKYPMEKITVKEITESAGVIRPTFYNHFKDKYDVLEYVIWNDLLLVIKPLLLNNMVAEGLTLLFNNIKNDKEFYSNAVNIEGQNSFGIIARKLVSKMLLEVIEEKNIVTHNRYRWLTGNVIAEYYAQSMCYVAEIWIKTGYLITPAELSEIYEYVSRHSMVDVIGEL